MIWCYALFIVQNEKNKRNNLQSFTYMLSLYIYLHSIFTYFDRPNAITKYNFIHEQSSINHVLNNF